MLLSSSIMGKVFAIYAAFWVVVLIVLYLGVGALMRRRERILARRNAGHSGGHH
jgi:hypothetical protein